MKNKTLLILLAILMLFLSAGLRAQNGVGMYFTDILPQRNLANPSFSEPYSLSVGFPGLSGLHVSVDNNFFSWNALVRRGGDDSLRLDLTHLLGKAGNLSRIKANIDEEILHIGWRKKQNNFQIGLSLHADMQLVLSKETLSFLLQGPGSHVGENTLAKNRLDLNSYAYLYFGYSRTLNKHLSVGGRLKLIHGIVNFHTQKLNVKFDIQNSDMSNPELVPYQYRLQVDGVFQTNLPITDDFKLGDFDFSPFRNLGAALDVGMNYNFGKNWNVSVSVSDLGFIVWGDQNATRIESRKDVENFTYRGLDIQKLQDNSAGEIFKDLVQSVKDTLGFAKSDDTKGYVRALPATINVGLSYTLFEMHRFGLLFKGQFYNKYFAPEIGVSYTLMPCRWFALNVGNTFCSGNILNLGLSFVLNLGPLQLYAGVDRINAFNVAKMRTASAVFGINFVFGGGKYDWYTGE